MITDINFRKDVNNKIEVVFHMTGKLHKMFSKSIEDANGTWNVTFYEEGLASFGYTTNQGKWWSSNPSDINDAFGLKGKYRLAKDTVCIYTPEYGCGFGGYAITLDYLEQLIAVHYSEIGHLDVLPFKWLEEQGRSYCWHNVLHNLKGFRVTGGAIKFLGYKYIKCLSPDHALCLVRIDNLVDYCLKKYGMWCFTDYVGKKLK